MHINKIYKMLHWHSSLENQLEGIKYAQKLEDLTPLILPFANGESKAVWENCARALYEISDEKLEKYLPLLFEWFQDFSWPGAIIILDRLKFFSGERMEKPFIGFIGSLGGLDGEERMMWMDNLSELLDNEDFKSKLPIEVFKSLQKHYHNNGWWYKE